MEQDIRWKQRYSNFKNSLGLLTEAIEGMDLYSMSKVEKAGFIHFFEMTFELAWKTLKDVLEDDGFTDVTGPNSVLKQALNVGLIGDQDGWQDMKNARNSSSHTYDQEKADKMYEDIAYKFYGLFLKLDDVLNKRLE